MRHVGPTPAPLVPLLLLGLAGCLFDPVVDEVTPIRCVDDDDCPGEMACAGGRCLGQDAIAGERCGDGLVARSGAEACDDGSSNSDTLADACRTDCTTPRCGDGVTDRAEGCDDGNTDDNDACTSFCVPSTCGDGAVNSGVEECDDGNGDFGDDCLPNCRLNACGDGFLRRTSSASALEECDDGNLTDTDGCRSSCVPNVCGDGVANALAEQCDDGNADDADACLSSCVAARCGDGVVEREREECDDGNGDFGDGCLPTCRDNVCGDGFENPGTEACDDGNTDDDDSCLSTCVVNVCGDGIINDIAEECDDGNDIDGDACRVTCRVARCGDGVVQVGVEGCDDGNAAADDDCLPSCVDNVCGDGVRQRVGAAPEDCDDGNTESLDGCSATCSLIVVAHHIDATFSSGPTWAAISSQADGGGDPVLAVSDLDGTVHLVNARSGEHVAVPVGAGLMAPAGERTDRGLAPRDDGSALAWEVSDLATGPPEVADAGFPGEPPVVLDREAFGRRLRVVELASAPPLQATGGLVAVAGVERFVATADGALVRVGDGALEELLPAGGTGPVGAPTAVLDGTRAPVGAMLGRGPDLHFVSLLTEAARDPATGETILDPVDGGFVGDDPIAGDPIDGGFREREVPCAPLSQRVAGEIVGQIVVTDRSEAYLATTLGEAMQFPLRALACPVGLGPGRSAQASPAIGPPAVTVDRLTGVASVVFATATGLARVIFPDRADPSAVEHPLPSAPIGPIAINEDGDAFVGSVDARLYGQSASGTVFLDVALPGRVVGAPLVIDPVVIVATTTGDVIAVENGGRLPGASAGDNGTWLRSPGGDLCGSSAGRVEEERDGGCATGQASSAIALLALGLARRRRPARATA